MGVSPAKVPSVQCVFTHNLINCRSTVSSEQVFEGQSQKKPAKAQHTNCVIS